MKIRNEIRSQQEVLFYMIVWFSLLIISLSWNNTLHLGLRFLWHTIIPVHALMIVPSHETEMHSTQLHKGQTSSIMLLKQLFVLQHKGVQWNDRCLCSPAWSTMNVKVIIKCNTKKKKQWMSFCEGQSFCRLIIFLVCCLQREKKKKKIYHARPWGQPLCFWAFAKPRQHCGSSAGGWWPADGVWLTDSSRG